MRFSLLAAFLVLLALPLSQASAQRDDQFVWSLGGGVVIPSGLASDNHTAGPQGTLSFGIGMVDSPFGIRFDGMYAGLGDRTGRTTPTDQGSAKLFNLSGNAVFNVYGSNAHVYAVGGVGGYWYNPDGVGSKSKNDFALQAGLGVWVPFANAFVEAKWVNLYRALPDASTGELGKRSARLYPITLGIMF